MNYENFIKKYQNFPVFSNTPEKVQLNRWIKAGKLIRLKRGLYTLPEEKRKVSFSLRWLANSLYSPSYLSLEYMLSFYDLIPERVSKITSVTLLKTACFENLLGKFSYKTLQKEHFFGFEESRDEWNRKILIASPEKALLDFIYLYPYWKNTPEFLNKNIRLQQLDQLKAKLLKEFAEKFHSKKISNALTLILQEMKK